MLAYNIAVVRDTATPATRALAFGLQQHQLNEVVGPAAQRATREHFEELNRDRPNWLGGTRTNYYATTGKQTSWTHADDGVIISMAQIGLRLHYYGGTVTAGKGISSFSGKPTRFITIPVNPKAHGHRASEFDLELVYNHNGVPVALATKSTLGVSLKQSKTGKVIKRAIGQRGEIMYLLRRSITVQPDPSVLPAPDRIYGAAFSMLNAHVDRLLERAAANNN